MKRPRTGEYVSVPQQIRTTRVFALPYNLRGFIPLIWLSINSFCRMQGCSVSNDRGAAHHSHLSLCSSVCCIIPPRSPSQSHASPQSPVKSPGFSKPRVFYLVIASAISAAALSMICSIYPLFHSAHMLSRLAQHLAHLVASPAQLTNMVQLC